MKLRLKKYLPFLIIKGAVLILLTQTGVFGQRAQQTDNRADQTLRGTGRVNPSTLGAEMSVPLMSYPGRGINLPIALNYSSKAWRMKFLGMRFGTPNCRSRYRAKYSENAASGWTSSLGIAYIEYTGSDTIYNQNGFAYSGSSAGCADIGTPNNGYIKRIEIHLPSGEAHELRVSDDPLLYPGNATYPREMTGTYYAVDGSNLKYVEDGNGTYRLYLPDGSSYDFAAGVTMIDQKTIRQAVTQQDISGNRLTFHAPDAVYRNGSWTDTLNRTVPVPLGLSAPDAPGTQDYQLPGIPNAYKFYWKQLKGGSAAESGLTDFSQTLRYPGDSLTNVQGFPTRAPETVLFHSGLSGYAETSTGDTEFNPIVLTAIELPNGQKYQFGYDIYGEIDRIQYPTGGEERMTYDQTASISSYDVYGAVAEANRGVVSRSVYENANAAPLTSTYATVLENYGSNLKATATAPDGTRSERFIYATPGTGEEFPGTWGFDSSLAGMPYEERSFSSTGQLLAKKMTTWTVSQTTVPGSSKTAERNPRVTREESIVYDQTTGAALSASTTTDYNGDPANPATALNVRKVTQYGYTATVGSLGTLEKSAETDYLNDANYAAVDLRSLPVETRLKDAAGIIKARSQIVYDEPGYGNGGSGGVRGQATTARSWTDIAANQYIQTRIKYDVYGNPYQTIDANGDASTIGYDATYHCYPVSTTSAVPDPSGQTGSLTPLTSSTTFDSVTGLPTSMTDANGQTSTMEYNDPLLRPTRAIAPNGQQTITEYGAGTSASTRFVHTKTQIDETKWKEGISWYDGLGRGVKSQSVDSNGDVLVNTEYDQFGRPWKTTNPYRAGETIYKTENFYDTAGRLYKVKSPDNAEVTTAYGLATTGARIGTVVTVTDQAGKQRRSVTNALGQLTEVDEPNDQGQLDAGGAAAQPTVYLYDVLGNLTTVTQASQTAAQCGGAANCSQTRSFDYDSLSRLKQATNPESGTISYIYDSNGNLTNKTDARGVVTSYVYDALNRVTNRNYLAPAGLPNYGATPNVAYTYDNLPNAKGKLTKVSSADSTTEYTSFDILGRVLAHRQTTDGNVYTTGYSYNLSGALIEETYPSGRTVKNTLDNDGRLATVGSRKTGGAAYRSYADSFAYTAAGAVSSMRLGNGKWESTIFNSRLQPTQIALGNAANRTNLLKLDYDYGSNDNNGNVKSQQITVPTIGSNAGFTAVQNYSYDSLNRLKDAKETISNNQTWKQTFQFDRFGNRTFDTSNGNTTTLAANCPTNVCNPSANTTNNRLIGASYDSSGNTTIDAENRTFTYDAENKQIQVSNSSGIVGRYIYDGDGKRVKKISAAEITVFVYDAGGKMVAEYSTAMNPTPQTSYLTSDNLGTPRINTDANGAVISRHDYQPFGEEAVTAQRVNRSDYQGDAVRNQFTGYQKDEESDLDFAQARMFSSNFGRFTSPDSFTNDTHVSDPQSWNLYVYVRNNPLNLIDPLGSKAIITSNYDADTGITTIKIKASFAIYGANGQNVSQKDIAKYAEKLAAGIKAGYDGAYTANGKNFIVQTDIKVQTSENEDAAKSTGADNLIEIGNRELPDSDGDALAVAYHNEGEDFDRVRVSNQTSSFGSNTYDSINESTFAHEFGHLLGLPDMTRPGLMVSGSPANHLTDDDFADLFSAAPRSTHIGLPPSGPGIKPGDKGYRGLETQLFTSGSRILNSTNPSMETRRSNSTNTIEWGRWVKK